MPTDCTDVCEVVIDLLLHAGFTKKDLDLDNEDNHDKILDALGKIKLVKI